MTDWFDGPKPGFKRKISFIPGYDKRGEKPNYGQHPMHLAFVLHGPLGALVFDLNSGAYPAKDQRDRGPQAWGVQMHWFIEHDVHSNEIQDCCDWLDGLPCIGQQLRSSMSEDTERLFKTLILAGEEVFWHSMLEFYEKEVMK